MAQSLLRAALIGVATGMRTSAGQLATTLQRRDWRTVLSVAAMVGELVVDKLPATPDRTQSTGLAGRAASSAFAAYQLRNGKPAAQLMSVAVASAMLSAFACSYARKKLTESTNVPDVIVAFGEDAVMLMLVLLSQSRPH